MRFHELMGTLPANIRGIAVVSSIMFTDLSIVFDGDISLGNIGKSQKGFSGTCIEISFGHSMSYTLW